MICLGPALDLPRICAGTINGMSCQQGVEGERVFFTGVGDNATGHFDITPDEHDYELQPVGGWGSFCLVELALFPLVQKTVVIFLTRLAAG